MRVDGYATRAEAELEAREWLAEFGIGQQVDELGLLANVLADFPAGEGVPA